jgi:hypothetical protein
MAGEWDGGMHRSCKDASPDVSGIMLFFLTGRYVKCGKLRLSPCRFACDADKMDVGC